MSTPTAIVIGVGAQRGLGAAICRRFAAERYHVFVAGRQVVKEGRVLTMDYATAAAGVNESQKRALAKISSLDWAGRTVDELAPPSFRYVGSNVR